MMPEGAGKHPYVKEEPTGKLNYWGYTKGGVFAPKASYSSGKEKHPVKEFKELVKALHKAGLEIIVELYFTGEESPVFALDAVRSWVERIPRGRRSSGGKRPAETDRGRPVFEPDEAYRPLLGRRGRRPGQTSWRI